ncbi:esterase [Sphaerisporangium rufum]|uniref:Esterase n=1 Tax=Sphaerisporangium rufum TaxID=1381558 RepID=A0A919R2N0_9ACTN|nr:alpha/beta hydrolase-fold protein [Sphaerisporangium rufum]GII78198.1 esterase [Sphaerisporangium rufum]
MELTATSLQVAAILLAVGGLAGSAWWLWPRLSARTWPAVLGRVGVLVGNQVLTLGALALLINNYFGFYGSWDDLLGSGRGAAAPIVADLEQEPPDAPSSARVQVMSSSPVTLSRGGQRYQGGRLEHVVVTGAASTLSAPAYVYLPPQYFDPRYAGTRFPAVLVLTGYPGDARNLITRMNIPATAARSIDRREMAPAILILMRPTLAPPRDTECMDVPDGPQVETFFTKDLREAMAGVFRVGTEPASWGVLGGSTGGYCALKMSMRHPESFGAAASLSGYYRPPADATTGDLFGGSPDLAQENDLMWRLANLPHPPISVLVTSSRKGESNYRTTLDFLAAVRPPMQAASLILPSGGHNFTTWNRELPQALPWIVSRLRLPDEIAATPAPAPGPATSAAPVAPTP